MKILLHYAIDVIYPVDESNFILLHDSFVDPEFVLRDDVTILQVTKYKALFIQQDSNMAPPFSNKYSFVVAGQLMTGSYVISMPIESFLKLAQKVECEEDKIVLIHNIGRCGGSLLTSCFDATGRAVAWNEPRVLDSVMRLANFAWDRKTSRRIIRATFKMLAKPYHGFRDTTLNYVIKIPTFLNGDNDVICKAVPKAKHIFVYRDLNVAAHSLQRINYLVPARLPVLLSRWLSNPQGVLFFFHLMGARCKGCDDITYRYDVSLEFAYRIQLVSFVAYNRMRQVGVPVVGVRYEDLIAEPDRVLSELLNLTNMPETLVKLANNAFNADSQATQPFNQQGMAKLKNMLGEPDCNEELLRDEMQELFEEAGVPGPRDWEKEFIKLPGTI